MVLKIVEILRFWLAFFTARIVTRILKLLGRNATQLPGKLAIKIFPNFLQKIAKPTHIIAVTGTNGKTTTANILTSTLKNLNIPVINNSLGSNMAEGIATLFLQNVTLIGQKTKAQWAILETDERSAHFVLPAIKPEFLLITNILRDTPRRNAHVEYIASFIAKYVPKNTKIIKCYDDPVAMTIAPNNSSYTFSILPQPDESQKETLLNDCYYCLTCGNKLNYTFRRYDHIGVYSCTGCATPKPPNLLLTSTNPQNNNLIIHNDTDTKEFKRLGSNIADSYNLLACVATLNYAGFTLVDIAHALSKVELPPSRFNEKQWGEYRVVQRLCKTLSPLATSLAFDSMNNESPETEICAIIIPDYLKNNPQESQFWMYDTDFEYLLNPRIKQIILAFSHAEDFLVRCAFAGISLDKITIIPNSENVVKNINWNEINTVYLFNDIFSQAESQRVLNDIQLHIEKENHD